MPVSGGTITMITSITGLIAWLGEMIADLVAGNKSLDEAKAELEENGINIASTAADDELGEYKKIFGVDS